MENFLSSPKVSSKAAVRGDPRRLSQPSSSNSARCEKPQPFTCSSTGGRHRLKEHQCINASCCSISSRERYDGYFTTPWNSSSKHHTFIFNCFSLQVSVLQYCIFHNSPVCYVYFCTEPVTQFNTWMGSDSSHPSLPKVCSPRLEEEHIYLEDVQADEDKLNSSVLSSESTFLPFTSDLDPQTTHSESEDETETFEPDSLAPKWTAQPKTHNTKKTYHSSRPDKQERELEEEVISGAAGAAASVEVRVSTPQNDLETTSDFGKAEMGEAPKQGEVSESKPSFMEANTAAVKIQSWWRGQHTRCCHPMAREVRSEIRLRRMQDHILCLTEKFNR